MAADYFTKIRQLLRRILKPGTPPGSTEVDARIARRERIIVFIVAYVISISMWFVVNLSGDYSVTIDVPLRMGNIPDDMALVEGLPQFVQVEVSGDGWKLVNLHNNPPEVFVDVIEGEINLFDQVRQRFTVEQDVSVLKVQPFVVNIELEAKIEKKIPIRLASRMSYMNRYGIIGEPKLSPDSITIMGAESQVRDIDEWVIPDTLVLSDLKDDVNQLIPLEPIDPLIEYDVQEVNFTANVSEFTESEVTVYIRTRGLPRGNIINYNPSSVTIRFDVPIEQYSQVQNERPYEVYVPYSEILEDSSGFVTPDIEQISTKYELRLRSFQPKAVAYFSVLD